jgi:DNA-directed RNA polymerase beta subunit
MEEFCPIETPEGTEIGLRKNLSIFSKSFYKSRIRMKINL